MIGEFINTAARVVGFAVLGSFGALILMAVLADITPSIGGTDSTESENTVNDIIKEGLEDPERIETIRPREDDLVKWDWSMSDGATREEIHALKSVVERDKYHAHPFPQSPDTPFHDEWHWSGKVVGIWTEEPTFYAETEDGEQIDVTPDLSSWLIMTEYDSPITGEKYGYNDNWEREHIRGGD